MADKCEQSSSEGFDSILSDNFSIYSESNTSDKDEQYEEATGSFSSVFLVPCPQVGDRAGRECSPSVPILGHSCCCGPRF